MTERRTHPCCDDPDCPCCLGTGIATDPCRDPNCPVSRVLARLEEIDLELSADDAAALIQTGQAITPEPCVRCGRPGASTIGTDVLLCDDCVPVPVEYLTEEPPGSDEIPF